MVIGVVGGLLCLPKNRSFVVAGGSAQQWQEGYTTSAGADRAIMRQIRG
ncbi:MAG: hypothetical protein WBB55_11350 [Anaerolineales bacterium]